MKISIIGAGAMGGAMAEGLIKGDYIKPVGSTGCRRGMCRR